MYMFFVVFAFVSLDAQIYHKNAELIAEYIIM